MNWTRITTAAALFGALLYVGTPAAQAGTRKFEDDKRGFRLKIDDDFNEVPPKLDDRTKHIAAQFYIDKAKYRGNQPTFMVMWFSRPKVAPVTPSAKDEKEEGEGGEKEAEKEKPDPAGPKPPKSADEAFERLLKRAQGAFGKFMPLAQRRAEHPKDFDEFVTKDKLSVDVMELNRKKPKKGQPEPGYYGMFGKLELDRLDDVVEIGFLGYCPAKEAKKLRKTFKRAIESFEVLDVDPGVSLDRDILEMDADEFEKHVRESKVPDGWGVLRTPHYLLLYNKEVKRALVQKIAQQVEVLRETVYVPMFPADKEITAISVIRICKDKSEYTAYGGPGGSAGYWAWRQMELVFYESNPKDFSLRVLYHEAFHQYIFYSVGDFSPHSWFNEGHGDFFAGHDFKGGRFKLDEFGWRRSSKADKRKYFGREGLLLSDWLTWSQGKYYGYNTLRIPGGTNYAMGWDFVYFLRTTRKKQYQNILPIYFDVLKTRITTVREELIAASRKKWAKDAKEGDEFKIDWAKVRKALGKRNQEFLGLALKEAFKGVDLTQLQKDWLKN